MLQLLLLVLFTLLVPLALKVCLGVSWKVAGLVLCGSLGAAQDVVTTVIKVNASTFAFVASGVTKYSRNVSLAGKRKVFYVAKTDTTAGASASMLITSQHSYDGGQNWLDSDAFTAITTDNVFRKDPAAEVAPIIRFKLVSSGTFTTMNVNLWVACVDPSIDARR